MFAQHLLLQTCGLDNFEKMQEAAGSWSGITNNASTTVNKIAAVFRITPMDSTTRAARRQDSFVAETWQLASHVRSAKEKGR